MPILKKGEIEAKATAYGTEVKSTGYVFYSYDKKASALFFQFRNQNGETTDIANAKIRLLLIKNDDEDKEFIPNQEDFEIISKPGGKAKFVLPEMLLAYQGKVTGYIYLDFEDGSQTDEGQFTFRIRRSMITHVLPKAGDKYVQDFEDVKERVEQAGDSATKDIEKAKDDAESQIGEYAGEVESAKDNAESQIGDYAGEIESAKQDISSSASDVQSTADKANEDIDDLVKTTEDARDDAVKTMNELDYSDRNLLVSDNLFSYTHYNKMPVVEENGRKITTEFVSTDITLKGKDLKPDGKYTLSGRIEINGQPITRQTISRQVINTRHDNSENERFEILSDGSFIVTETYDSETDGNWIIHTPFDGIEPGDVITFYDLQFQPGSVPTPWQPSFGDYDAKIKKLDEMFDNKGSTYTDIFYRNIPPVIDGTTITFKGAMRLYRYSRALGKWTKRLVVSHNLQDGETEQTFEWTHNTVIVWNLDDNTLVREVYPTKIDYNAITLFRNIDGKLVSGALLAQYKTEMLSRQRLDINGVIEKDIGRPIKINNISKGRSAPNGAVVVGNEYWAFYASNDAHTSYNICDRFLINDDYTFTHLGYFEHNWGHCNSLDYCEETDTLILGNGSGDYNLSGKIFIIENIQALKENARNTLADVATIIDVGMRYGAKVNVIWGGSNTGNYNVAHIITNDNKNIIRIILGRTNGSFDGSFVELKQYEQSDGLGVVQGAVYGHDGYLYVGLGHSGAWYAKQRLRKDGKIGVESAREIFYDENGDVLAGFTESISMYQDKLLLRTTTNGGEVYVLYK